MISSFISQVCKKYPSRVVEVKKHALVRFVFERITATFRPLVSELRKQRAILDSSGESMLKKVLSVALSCLLISITASVVYDRSQDDKRIRQIEKIKENVRKLGVGPDARVEVTLHDGRKFKGTIREATDDTFLVREEKTQTIITVPYTDVAKLKGRNGLTAAKVGINVAKGVGVVAGVAAIFTLFMYIIIPKS